MNFGSLADWAAAIGGFATVVAALIGARRAERRAERAEARLRKEQADRSNEYPKALIEVVELALAAAATATAEIRVLGAIAPKGSDAPHPPFNPRSYTVPPECNAICLRLHDAFRDCDAAAEFLQSTPIADSTLWLASRDFRRLMKVSSVWPDRTSAELLVELSDLADRIHRVADRMRGRLVSPA